MALGGRKVLMKSRILQPKSSQAFERIGTESLGEVLNG